MLLWPPAPNACDKHNGKQESGSLRIWYCGGVQTISATPRQLESLIRIGEALARMRLSPTVTRADAAEALRLMQARASRLLSAHAQLLCTWGLYASHYFLHGLRACLHGTAANTWFHAGI